VVNRQNYLWVKAHLLYLREVVQLHEASVTRYWAYLRHLLLWADETLVTQAEQIRPTFPAHIVAEAQRPAGAGLAPATIKKILQSSQRFLRWLKQTYPSDCRTLSLTWIETLRPPRLPERQVEHEYVTLHEVLKLAHLCVEPNNLSLRRDQAGALLLFLSGMRVSALGSLPIAAVDIPGQAVKQWPALGIRTKNSRSATTYLLPIPELLDVVETWDRYVRDQLPPTAMWFTPIVNDWGKHSLTSNPAGASRSVAIGRRLRKLFELIGLPYKSAHKFRHGHAVWALQHAQNMADYKAISQNLMHSDIRITDGIYAPLLGGEVQQRISSLSTEPGSVMAGDKSMSSYLGQLSRREMSEALRMLADAITR